MSWNYRVVRTTDQLGDWLAIHEVYYRTKDAGEDYDNICNWTEAPINISGETIEALAELLELVKPALAKPILDLSRLENR